MPRFVNTTTNRRSPLSRNIGILNAGLSFSDSSDDDIFEDLSPNANDVTRADDDTGTTRAPTSTTTATPTTSSKNNGDSQRDENNSQSHSTRSAIITPTPQKRVKWHQNVIPKTRRPDNTRITRKRKSPTKNKAVSKRPTFRKEVTVRLNTSTSNSDNSDQESKRPSSQSRSNVSTSSTTKESKRPSCQSRPSWIPPRGLAIDTRTIETFEGDAIGNVLINHVTKFLQSAKHRGLPPNVVASTIIDTTKQAKQGRKSSVGAGGGTSDARKDNECSSSSSSSSNAANRVFMKVQANPYPNASDEGSTASLFASMSSRSIGGCNSDSNLFSLVKMASPVATNDSNRLVQMQMQNNDEVTEANRCNGEIGEQGSSIKIAVPKNLLACDSWRTFGDLVNNMVTEYDSTNKLLNEDASITGSKSPPLNVTLMTHDLALFMDENMDSHKRGMNRFWDRMRGFFLSSAIRSIHIVVFETGAVIAPHAYHRHTHKFKIAQFTRMINNHLTKLADKEYKNNAIEGGSSTCQGFPMNIQLDRVDFNPISFQSLLRNWMNDIMGPASGGSGRIQFDLPETMDGTQCAVALDLSYTLLPHRFDSVLVDGLIMDMKLMTQASYFEVIQLVPLASVDLSLVCGVNMTAKAGLVDDLDQYREMKRLVAALYKYLQAKDMAIVLRCTTEEKKAATLCNGRELPAGYHSGVQCLLLLADDDDTGRSDHDVTPSSCAMKLFRYTCENDQILQLPEDQSAFGTAFIESDHEKERMDQMYDDYVSNSLDFLEIDHCKRY